MAAPELSVSMLWLAPGPCPVLESLFTLVVWPPLLIPAHVRQFFLGGAGRGLRSDSRQGCLHAYLGRITATFKQWICHLPPMFVSACVEAEPGDADVPDEVVM
jgi:hypothetical protein